MDRVATGSWWVRCGQHTERTTQPIFISLQAFCLETCVKTWNIYCSNDCECLKCHLQLASVFKSWLFCQVLEMFITRHKSSSYPHKLSPSPRRRQALGLSDLDSPGVDDITCQDWAKVIESLGPEARCLEQSHLCRRNPGITNAVSTSRQSCDQTQCVPRASTCHHCSLQSSAERKGGWRDRITPSPPPPVERKCETLRNSV